MEVRDAEGKPVGRVTDVYVERVDETISYVAVEGDSPDDVRLVPVGIVRMVEIAGVPALSVAVEGDRILGGPTMEPGAPVSVAHEQEVAGYFRDLHGAGYMRPWGEPPEVHGAGYMRPGAEPIQTHGAGYMRPGSEPPETHGAGYMRPEGEPPETGGAGYMQPQDQPPEVGGAGRMDPALLTAVKSWRE
jgi:hypothetical protein